MGRPGAGASRRAESLRCRSSCARASAAFPDLHFGEPDPPLLSVCGDVVFWAWHMQGTHRGPIDPPGFAPTGRRMRVDGVDQWTMRDGRIAPTARSTT